jgi:hypothetical protein
MIRATLLLATALLLGLGGVVWVARDLDPLRVIERFAPAQVRTVDLTGSEAFVRRELAPAAPMDRELGPGPEAAPGLGSAGETGPPPPARAVPGDVGPAPGPGAFAAEPPEVVMGVPGRMADIVDSPGASLGSEAFPEKELEPGSGPEAEAEAADAAADAVGAYEPVAAATAPLDPDASADLVRRMLAVYERAGERR